MVATLHWQSELLPLARRHAARTAIVDRKGAMRFDELFALAAGLAHRIIDDGALPCEPVATYLPNGREAVWASYGVTLAGAAEVRLNPALAGDDIAHCLKTAAVRRVVSNAERAPMLERLGARVTLVESTAPADLAARELPRVPDRGWGRIGFTSGTTGKPKGIVHSQETRWVHNVLLRSVLPKAPAPGDNVLLMTPYSHGAALMTQAFLDGGAAVTLLPGVDPDVVMPLIERRAVNQMFAPPTVLAKLLAAAGGRTLPGLEVIFTGTAPLTGTLYRAARACFGPIVRVTYGMSELWNPITVLTPAETDAFYGGEGEPASACVGWPGAGVEVEIAPAGEEDGEEDTRRLPAGELGRVRLRARHLYIGTLRDGAFSARDPEVFYETGDLGLIDEHGRLHLCGRAADVMKSGGYKIAPEEIEATLRPACAPHEVVVFSLPSEYWGEIVTMALTGPADQDLSRLEAALAGMTAYKRPRLRVLLPEIPRNSIGKIQRRIAREQVLERYRLEDGPRPRLIAK